MTLGKLNGFVKRFVYFRTHNLGSSLKGPSSSRQPPNNLVVLEIDVYI